VRSRPGLPTVDGLRETNMAESNPLKLSHEQLRATLAAQSLLLVELFERHDVSLELFSPREVDTQQLLPDR
jgi:hypothetical protein